MGEGWKGGAGGGGGEGLCKLMKWRSNRMKLRYARPGNAQFIAKIFVFNIAKTVAREMYTPRYLYIKYVFCI